MLDHDVLRFCEVGAMVSSHVVWGILTSACLQRANEQYRSLGIRFPQAHNLRRFIGVLKPFLEARSSTTD